MSKIIFPLISSLGLILLFVVVNLLVNQIKPSNSEVFQAPDGFSRSNQTVGEIGGAHYLRNSYVQSQQGYKRLVIETQLNRASVLEDSIETPYTTTEIVPDNGSEVLVVKLADTTRIYEEEGRTEDIYTGLNDRLPDSDLPLTRVEAMVSTEQGQEIRVHFGTNIKGYRLQADPEKSGNIWIDILE